MRTHALRIVVLVVLLVAGWWWSAEQRDGSAGRTAEPSARSARDAHAGAERGEKAILAAFRNQQSDVWVQADGIVQRLLADDLEGSRHQRFIVRLASGHTVLVSHNIDLAPRVPLRAGDAVEFRGEYEWNAQGGVVHWTHHDPRGQHEGGWVRHAGERYR